MCVMTLGAQKTFNTCELSSQKARSRELKGLGGRQCPAADPTLAETVSSPASAYPGPGTRFAGLSLARYLDEGVGTRRNAAKALGSEGAEPPEEEEWVGVGAAPFPAPSLPHLALPPRSTSPRAHPAAGTGCSFAPVPQPPRAPALTFPSLPSPSPVAPGAGTLFNSLSPALRGARPPSERLPFPPTPQEPESCPGRGGPGLSAGPGFAGPTGSSGVKG